MDDIHTVRGRLLQFQVADLVINTVVPCDVKVIWFEQWTGMIGAGACRRGEKKTSDIGGSMSAVISFG